MTVLRCFLSAVVQLALLLPSAWADPIDDYVRSQLAARHLPGVSIAIVRNGQIVKSAGYGLANLEHRADATPQTVYEIGSISKQFTANAILLLVEDGKLKLDDPLTNYIAAAPATWSQITIRHVLTHTAGLADFDTGAIGFSYRREYTNAEFVALLAAQPLRFKPGEQWAYTNAFPLLGMVIERASGLPYTTFVETRIFKPLGLMSARFKVSGDVVEHRADGYQFVDGKFRHGEVLRPSVIAANGGILMNVIDLARWDIAVTTGKLLKPESLKAMSTPVQLSDGRTVSHGLGWFMDEFNGHRFGAHWGTTVTGHSAVIRRYVDDNVTVIVLANLNDDGLAVDAISKRIADVYVPGVEIHGLPPSSEEKRGESERLRTVLSSIAAGTEHPRAPGMATRLPARVRERLADTLRTATTFESLGEERLGAFHFNLDPTVVILQRYRASTPLGMRYLTIRLSSSNAVLGVVIED